MTEQMKSVLILEPDEAVRSAISSMLKQLGWIVCACAQGKKLHEEIENHHPAVLISESLLPDLSAGEVLGAAGRHGIPVVFLGHEREVQRAVDLMRDGAAGFLEKPFPQKRLIELIDKLTA